MLQVDAELQSDETKTLQCFFCFLNFNKLVRWVQMTDLIELIIAMDMHEIMKD